MIIVDTSVWIEYLRCKEPYYDKVSVLIDSSEILVLEGVFAELFRGAKTKSETDLLNRLWLHLPKLNEQGLLINAGKISKERKLYNQGLSLIDCYILAAALKAGAQIWTLDQKLQASFDKIFLQ